MGSIGFTHNGPDSSSEILLVEDDPGTSRITTTVLENAGYRVTVARSTAQAIPLLESQYFPVIVSDLYLDGDTGLSLIPYTKLHSRPSFIIFLTGQGSIGTTVKAIHEGAFAYLGKPSDLSNLEVDLIPVVERAVKQLAVLESQRKDIATPRSSTGRSLI